MKSSCQIYVKGSVEAAAFYQAAFGLSIGMTHMGDDGTYIHVSLMSGENEVLAIGEDSSDQHFHDNMGNKFPLMAFNMAVETRDAVDRAYAILSEGMRKIIQLPGTPFGDEDGDVYSLGLVDKYGVLLDVIYMPN